MCDYILQTKLQKKKKNQWEYDFLFIDKASPNDGFLKKVKWDNPHFLMLEFFSSIRKRENFCVIFHIYVKSAQSILPVTFCRFYFYYIHSLLFWLTSAQVGIMSPKRINDLFYLLLISTLLKDCLFVDDILFIWTYSSCSCCSSSVKCVENIWINI